MKNYIVTIGSACIDEYYQCENWPEQGSKAMIKPISIEIGGMIANAASILGYYGVETYMVDYICKEDENLVKNEMKKYNICTEYISLSDDKITPKAFVMLSGNERTIFVKYNKPQLKLNEMQQELIINAGYIYSTISEIKSIEKHEDILQKLSKRTKIVFDVEPATFRDRKSEEYYFYLADVLIFNEFAFKKYCANDEKEKILNDLFMNKESKVVVVTKGAKGSEIFTKDNHIVTPGINANVVDNTGAGDAFNATFVYCLHQGYDFKYSSELANIAGSKAVEKYGPKGGICSIDELKRINNSKC